MLAESEAEPPTTVDEVDKLVLTVGATFCTWRDSEPHVLSAALLFPSPLYVACQLNVPVLLKITLTGPADPDTRATVALATGVPLQRLPRYALNVIVPVGLKPPDTLALSETELPTVADNTDRVVVTLGVALVTVRVSEPHVLLTALLLPSP